MLPTHAISWAPAHGTCDRAEYENVLTQPPYEEELDDSVQSEIITIQNSPAYQLLDAPSDTQLSITGRRQRNNTNWRQLAPEISEEDLQRIATIRQECTEHLRRIRTQRLHALTKRHFCDTSASDIIPIESTSSAPQKKRRGII